MKKLGLICMALVLALGLGGVAYASWTDTITIDGTVETGTVDVVIEGLSYIEVWKDLDSELAVTVFYVTDEAGNPLYQDGTEPTNGVLVAWTTSTKTGDDAVTVGFNNLFPCDWFKIDVKLHCVGSVPVKINAVTLESDAVDPDWIDTLITSGDIYCEMFRWDPTDPTVLGAEVYEGAQLEECDYIVIIIWVHIPQDDAYQAKTVALGTEGNLTATVEFIQWNNY